MRATFRALTTNVSVDIGDDVELADLAQSLIASYPPATGEPILEYVVENGRVLRDGGVVRLADDPRDVVPIFEIDLYEQLIARAEPGWLLHAAAVEVDGASLVFAGPSGAGKTTLTLELVSRGYRLLTEEIVWIGDHAMACGLSRPLHVVSGETKGIPADWRRVPYPLRAADGLERAVVVPPSSSYQHQMLTVRALIRLTHGPDREPGLTRVSPRDAFPRFWDPTLRPDNAALTVATSVLRTVPAYRLASRTFAEALAGLDALLSAK